MKITYGVSVNFWAVRMNNRLFSWCTAYTYQFTDLFATLSPLCIYATRFATRWTTLICNEVNTICNEVKNSYHWRRSLIVPDLSRHLWGQRPGLSQTVCVSIQRNTDHPRIVRVKSRLLSCLLSLTVQCDGRWHRNRQEIETHMRIVTLSILGCSI
jgi:hypothetical protein